MGARINYNWYNTYSNRMPVLKPGVELIVRYFEGEPTGRYLEIFEARSVIKKLSQKYGLNFGGATKASYQPSPQREVSHRPRPKEPDTDASGRKIQRYELKRDPSGEPAKDENGDLIIITVYEDEPKSKEDYNERGIACAKKGKYDLAISEFTKAIETNPRDAVAYNNRGSAYKAKGEFERAISDYNKAIEINPRLAEVYSNRAGAYYSKGEYDKAWEDVHQAQSLGYQVNPQSLKALREASGRER